METLGVLLEEVIDRRLPFVEAVRWTQRVVVGSDARTFCASSHAVLGNTNQSMSYLVCLMLCWQR